MLQASKAAPIIIINKTGALFLALKPTGQAWLPYSPILLLPAQGSHIQTGKHLERAVYTTAKPVTRLCLQFNPMNNCRTEWSLSLTNLWSNTGRPCSPYYGPQGTTSSPVLCYIIFVASILLGEFCDTTMHNYQKNWKVNYAVLKQCLFLKIINYKQVVFIRFSVLS